MGPVEAHHARLGHPRIAGGDTQGVRYSYFDSTLDFGHLTEYFLPTRDVLAFWAALPRFP